MHAETPLKQPVLSLYNSIFVTVDFGMFLITFFFVGIFFNKKAMNSAYQTIQWCYNLIYYKIFPGQNAQSDVILVFSNNITFK